MKRPADPGGATNKGITTRVCPRTVWGDHPLDRGVHVCTHPPPPPCSTQVTERQSRPWPTLLTGQPIRLQASAT
ncbi:glycosyl hydrolase 108 family protein [Flaviflagellibacter deserti]|uniref:Glycosyl hydrolase 108 family protein n=1 Tax=Flaviflagellibacter deserti TaxID=2267266 RepID=A0ABV9Z0S7_9HYPH